MEQEQKSHVAEAKEQNLHRCHDKEGQLLKPDAGLGECQVHADGYQQKEHRLNNHVGGVPAEGDQAFYRKKAHKGQGQLTGQHTPQVSQDSVSGDGKEHKCQPDDHGAHILEKGGGGSPEAVQDASHGGCQVHERTQPGKDGDIGTGILVVENADAKLVPEESEYADAQYAHIAAVAQGHGYHGGNTGLIAVRLGFGHRGQKKHCHGVGDGRGKQDERQGHAGQHAVYGQGLGIGKAGAHQPVGNPYGFRASQHIKYKAVSHEGKSQGHKRGSGGAEGEGDGWRAAGIPILMGRKKSKAEHSEYSRGHLANQVSVYSKAYRNLAS